MYFILINSVALLRQKNLPTTLLALTHQGEKTTFRITTLNFDATQESYCLILHLLCKLGGTGFHFILLSQLPEK